MFHKIAESLPEATKGKMFGALCLKAANGKAGVMFYKGDMVFKLPKELESAALAMPGIKIFAPMGDRTMNGWTQVPCEHHGLWREYSNAAMEFVSQIEVPEKKPKKKD